MHRTPVKSIRATAPACAANTCSMCSRTARPVGRVTRSV